jgi:hypothetical protein
MIVALSPEDLVYDFKGNKRKPELKDFPALDRDILGPADVVIYRYQDKDEETTLILRGPLEESIPIKERCSKGAFLSLGEILKDI